MVEFALIFPLFLVIVMASIDFGWALRSYITATNAAREGARLGVVGASSDQIKTKTADASAGLLTTSNVTVTNAMGTPGDNVKVQVAYDYSYITPLPGLISLIGGGALPDPLKVSSSTTMRLE